MSGEADSVGERPCDFYARIQAGARVERDVRVSALVGSFWQRRRWLIALHAMAANPGAVADAYRPEVP